MICKRAIFGLTLLALVVACQPYISTDLDMRHHVRVDKYWLGYGKNSDLLSNKLLAVTAVAESGDSDSDGNPCYNVYVATIKGMQVYHEKDNSWALVLYGKNDGSDPGKPIVGVSCIYDDKPGSRILIASSMGLFWKKYNEPEVFKVDSPHLKAINLLHQNFKDPEELTRLSNDDIDGYDIDVYREGADEIVFVGSATGLYFCTEFNTNSESAANSSIWGNIVGSPIVTMKDKELDYPLTEIPGAYKEFNTTTKKMELCYKGDFYTGFDAWKINEVNYDPIYDPIYNPIYNKNPDFYVWEGSYSPYEIGTPITFEEFKAEIRKADPLFDDTVDIANFNFEPYQDEQYKARYAYESKIELNDRANPNNKSTGVVRAYAYYRDFFLKANRITGVSVYDGKIHLSGQNCGVSIATIPTNIDSSVPSTFKYIIWETYTNNYFHYPSIQEPVAERAEENFWSLSDTRGLCILANEYGIFYGAMDGGIHQAPTYQQIRTVRDVFGLAVDNRGNPQCILTKDGIFQYFNQYYYPEIYKNSTAKTKEEIADLYFRADRNPNDGISNDNLQEGLRLNWQEYTTRGWSIYVAQGSTIPYQSPVYKFPNNTIKKIRFGSLGKVGLIYIATANGMGVAEMRKNYSTHDFQKYPATVTGTEQYSVDFDSWGRYHKDMTRLVEENYMQDISVTKNALGDDYRIYCATDGQGLVRFIWKEYKQRPHNFDPNKLLPN